MNLLAKCLADNYFDVTFGYPRKRQAFLDKYREVFPTGPERDMVATPRVRNIVVIGAGASFAAFGGERFPTGRQAIKRLRKSLGVSGLRDALRLPDGGASDLTDRFKEEEGLIRQLHGIGDPRRDFESQLAILSKFYTPRQIRDAISRIYSRKYYPHLVFETIAHLLKHRFVDVVINYNFDEVLDQAIQEEVRGQDFQFVVSDGDCVPLSDLVVSDTLKVPLYIKPHGTVSHKSTLRFTKDAYIGMPNDLLTFTRKILLGHTREKPKRQRDLFHVNLISVGFAFTSIELVEMLKEHDRLRVFHINLAGQEAEITLKKSVRKLGKKVQHYLIGIRPPGSPSETLSDTTRSWTCIADAVDDLFGRVQQRFGKRYRPRHLGRHRLVHNLLFDPDPSAVPGRRPNAWPYGSGVRVPGVDRHYFLARLYVELAIALAKGNGRIDLSTLVQDRVGIYFREWRRVVPGGGESLRAICKEHFGLTDEEGFAGNVFVVKEWRSQTETESQDPKQFGFDVLDHCWHVLEGTSELAYSLWMRLRRALLQIDDDALRRHVRSFDVPQGHVGRVPPPLRKAILRPLAGLIHSDVHELAPQFGANALLLLNKPSRKAVIHTPLGMAARFNEMLNDERWDLFLGISEQGKVVEKLESHMKRDSGLVRRKANIVVADPAYPTVLDQRLAGYRKSNLLIGDAYRLPYWAHNHHVAIVLRMGVGRGEFEPLAAIAYHKPGLENRVNPVFVNDPDDLGMLVRTYFGYVAKAEKYFTKDAGPTGGVPDIDAAQAEACRKRLLQNWWDRMMGDREPDIV